MNRLREQLIYEWSSELGVNNSLQAYSILQRHVLNKQNYRLGFPFIVRCKVKRTNLELVAILDCGEVSMQIYTQNIEIRNRMRTANDDRDGGSHLPSHNQCSRILYSSFD